jgi:hypothetical protein
VTWLAVGDERVDIVDVATEIEIVGLSWVEVVIGGVYGTTITEKDCADDAAT